MCALRRGAHNGGLCGGPTGGFGAARSGQRMSVQGRMPLVTGNWSCRSASMRRASATASDPTHVLLERSTKASARARAGQATVYLAPAMRQTASCDQWFNLLRQPADSVQVDLCSCTDLGHARIDDDTVRTTHPASSTVAAALHLSPLPVRHTSTDGAAAGRACLRGGRGQLAR